MCADAQCAALLVQDAVTHTAVRALMILLTVLSAAQQHSSTAAQNRTLRTLRIRAMSGWPNAKAASNAVRPPWVARRTGQTSSQWQHGACVRACGLTETRKHEAPRHRLLNHSLEEWKGAGACALSGIPTAEGSRSNGSLMHADDNLVAQRKLHAEPRLLPHGLASPGKQPRWRTHRRLHARVRAAGQQQLHQLPLAVCGGHVEGSLPHL